METIRIQTSNGLLIGKLIDDDINLILETQRRMLEESNIRIGIAGQETFFN